MSTARLLWFHQQGCDVSNSEVMREQLWSKMSSSSTIWDGPTLHRYDVDMLHFQKPPSSLCLQFLDFRQPPLSTQSMCLFCSNPSFHYFKCCTCFCDANLTVIIISTYILIWRKLFSLLIAWWTSGGAVSHFSARLFCKSSLCSKKPRLALALPWEYQNDLDYTAELCILGLGSNIAVVEAVNAVVLIHLVSFDNIPCECSTYLLKWCSCHQFKP